MFSTERNLLQLCPSSPLLCSQGLGMVPGSFSFSSYQWRDSQPTYQMGNRRPGASLCFPAWGLPHQKWLWYNQSHWKENNFLNSTEFSAAWVSSVYTVMGKQATNEVWLQKGKVKKYLILEPADRCPPFLTFPLLVRVRLEGQGHAKAYQQWGTQGWGYMIPHWVSEGKREQLLNL